MTIFRRKPFGVIDGLIIPCVNKTMACEILQIWASDTIFEGSF